MANFDFYSAQYSRFGSELATEMRREVYGEDLGQQGWRTAAEAYEIAELLGAGPGRHLLDVACGAGGPSLALIERTQCRLTGVDIEAGAIAHATAQAGARRLAERASFRVADCGQGLPFPDRSFDGVVCIDAVHHLPDRFATLSGWARVLRERGRLAFTDPMIITGAVSAAEIELRASLGSSLLVPPGLNEKAIALAGLELLRVEDRTDAVAVLAGRWHSVRARRAERLTREEGEDWFGRRQQFLATTAELALTRRLSRFLFVAERRPALGSVT